MKKLGRINVCGRPSETIIFFNFVVRRNGILLHTDHRDEDGLLNAVCFDLIQERQHVFLGLGQLRWADKKKTRSTPAKA